MLISKLFQSVLAFFITVVAGTLIGAFAGWAVGLFFGKTILGILATVGISGFSMWQVGVFLGFIASFFRPLINYTKVTQKELPANPNEKEPA